MPAATWNDVQSDWQCFQAAQDSECKGPRVLSCSLEKQTNRIATDSEICDSCTLILQLRHNVQHHLISGFLLYFHGVTFSGDQWWLCSALFLLVIQEKHSLYLGHRRSWSNRKGKCNQATQFLYRFCFNSTSTSLLSYLHGQGWSRGQIWCQ